MRADKMGPSRRAASSNSSSSNNNNNNGRNDSRDRHKLMRQQFYTNNERSSSAQANRESPSERLASAAPATNSIRPLESHQLDPSSALDNNNNNNNHHQQQHRQHPYQEHLFNVRAATTTTTSSSTTTPPPQPLQQQSQLLRNDGNFTTSLEHDLSSSLHDRDCLTQNGSHCHWPTDSTATTTSQTGTTTTAPSVSSCEDGELERMGIRFAEINFSKYQTLWVVKSPQEILHRVALAAPIMLLGILGNATIIYSMCRFKQIRSKPTNIFILNMALADLLTTIVCPTAALITDVHQFYVLGWFGCHTEGFIKVTCLLVSAYSLIVISFDWFISVVRPCTTRMNIRQSWLALGSIWVISMAMASPLLFWRHFRERKWLDLTETWCCESLEYTKYYWVCMPFFLIYLPTFVMVTVLAVILVQMNRFEKKLRRGPRSDNGARTLTTNGPSSSAVMRSSSFSMALNSTHQAAAASVNSVTGGLTESNLVSRTDSLGAASGHNNSSLTMSMKYRRRIVKILFFYLLTSIVRWAPLQFTIIYRHFRTEPVPADWFFELNFFSQLCASLSAAMNPIIFGFLSQPFRRIVARFWLCRLFDKLWASKREPPRQPRANDNGHRNNRPDGGGGGGRGGEAHAMSSRPVALVNQQQVRMGNSNRTNHHAPSGHRATNTRADHEPKLTIEYIDHQHLQHHHQQSALSRSAARRSAASQRQVRHRTSHQQRPKSASIVGPHQRRIQGRQQESGVVQRSHSSRANGTAKRNTGPETNTAHSNNNHSRPTADDASRRPDHPDGIGIENRAYAKAADEDDDGPEVDVSPAGDATTSFMTRNGAAQAV